MEITGNKYLIHKKLFKLLGEEFSLFDNEGNMVAFADQRFKLREDIRIYTDKTKSTELLKMTTPKVIDFSPRFTIVDSATGETLGFAKRAGMKSSLIQDEWSIFDAQDNEIGKASEDSTFLALIRRFVVNLIPQSYNIVINGQTVCTMHQNFNPFTLHVRVEFEENASVNFDKRLVMAVAILICAIERRQN